MNYSIGRYKRKKWYHFSARKSIKANIQYIYSMRKITAILCTCTDRSETQEDRHFLEVIWCWYVLASAAMYLYWLFRKSIWKFGLKVFQQLQMQSNVQGWQGENNHLVNLKVDRKNLIAKMLKIIQLSTMIWRILYPPFIFWKPFSFEHQRVILYNIIKSKLCLHY